MASRTCPGLSCVGEILDVDGRIGGFNFQWAWSSGFVAGRALGIRFDSAAVRVLRSAVMHRPFLFWGFKSSHEILESRLGALEREVMAVVWKAGEINVREACERLGIAGRLHHRDDDDGPAVQEAAAGAAQSRPRVRLRRRPRPATKWKARSRPSWCRACYSVIAASRCRCCRRWSTRSRIAIGRCSTSSSV